MKIETMLYVLDRLAFRRGKARYGSDEYYHCYTSGYHIEDGIMRRYIRLQQENARLRDDVAFWKLEAQRGDNDDE